MPNRMLSALRVGARLLRHPFEGGRWIQHRKASCLRLGLPWISFGAIDALEQSLGRDIRAFEFGSGGSTIFLAERCRSLTSVEHDPEWADATSAELARRAIENVTLVRAPVPAVRYEQISGRWTAACDADEFARSGYLAAYEGRYDIVFIDGAEDFGLARKWRSMCFRRVEPDMAPGGMIVLDDSWAYPDILANNNAARMLDFEGFGPSRNGITSTAVFWY